MRLVDIDDAIEKAIESDKVVGSGIWETSEVVEYLEGLPTVDAVEVVRCKDCTKWGGVPFGNVCRRWSAPLAGMKNCTGPDDYCSYGERRADEGRNNCV